MNDPNEKISLKPDKVQGESEVKRKIVKGIAEELERIKNHKATKKVANVTEDYTYPPGQGSSKITYKRAYYFEISQLYYNSTKTMDSTRWTEDEKVLAYLIREEVNEEQKERLERQGIQQKDFTEHESGFVVLKRHENASRFQGESWSQNYHITEKEIQEVIELLDLKEIEKIHNRFQEFTKEVKEKAEELYSEKSSLLDKLRAVSKKYQ